MSLCLLEVASGLGGGKRGWKRWLRDCIEHIVERPMGQLPVGQREIVVREDRRHPGSVFRRDSRAAICQQEL
jgi:hypothetical protein